MARTFENPTNGYTQTVGLADNLCTLLFWWPYFILKGLWAHLAVSVAVPLGLAAVGGGPAALLGFVVTWAVYVLTVQPILANKFLMAGWREVGRE